MKLKFLTISLFSLSIAVSTLESMPIWSELRADTGSYQDTFFLKDIRLEDMSYKYGIEGSKGLIVYESVAKGEKL